MIQISEQVLMELRFEFFRYARKLADHLTQNSNRVWEVKATNRGDYRVAPYAQVEIKNGKNSLDFGNADVENDLIYENQYIKVLLE